MIVVVLCVFVIQGLLIEGFPAGEYDSSDGETTSDSVDLVEPVLARSITENDDTVLSSEPVPFAGSNENLQEDIYESSAVSSKNNATGSIDLTETATIKPVVVDTILTEVEAKVNQTLAKVDKVVESTLAKVDEEIKKPFLSNANVTNKIDSVIHDLMELRSKPASELLFIKDTIESELDVIHNQIRSVILESKIVEKTALNATELSDALVITRSEKESAQNMEKTEPLVKSETEKDELLLVGEEEIKTQLAQINDFTETEIEKINAFVESELALTEALIQSEVDKMNSFLKSKTDLVESEMTDLESILESELAIEVPIGVAQINDFIETEIEKINAFLESELALTEALIQSEVDKINSFVKSKTDLVESEMTDLESILESKLQQQVQQLTTGVAEFSGFVPASRRALIFGSTGYSPIVPVLEENTEKTVMEEVTQKAEVPVADEVIFTGTVPVSGRTLIFGSTGFLHPNLAPLKTHSKKTAERPNTIPILIESGPLTSESTEYTPISDAIEPIPETKVVLDEGSLLEPIMFREDNSETVSVIGKAAFIGVVPALGSVKIVGSGGCHPMQPTAETPDGKKYLWIANRPSPNAPPPVSRKPETTSKSDFPTVSTFTPEFPETVIMDSTKNYERLIKDYEALSDQKIDQESDLKEVGEVFFEGKAPALGSVSL